LFGEELNPENINLFRLLSENGKRIEAIFSLQRYWAFLGVDALRVFIFALVSSICSEKTIAPLFKG